MITVKLQNLSFYSFHGIHDEERILGGDYSVNVEVSFEENGFINHLDQSVDYSGIFNVVKDIMAIPTPMLETVAMKIAEKLREKFTIIEQLKVTIIKVHPPIENMEGSAAVIYEWKKK